MFDDDFLSGTALADRLEGVRVTDLADEDVPALAERWEAPRSWVEARQAVVLAELIERSTAVTGGDPALELGAALGVSPTSTWLRLGFAHGLSRLPRLAMMLRDGRIDVARARAVVGATSHLPAEAGGASRRRCWAGSRWTAGGDLPTARTLRARTDAAAMRIAPELARERRADTSRERCATMQVPEAGRGVLTLDGPASGSPPASRRSPSVLSRRVARAPRGASRRSASMPRSICSPLRRTTVRRPDARCCG